MMSGDPIKANWHPVDLDAARKLTEYSHTPGLVHLVAPAAIPHQLRSIPGAKDFYVSSYGKPIQIKRGMAAGGEIAVIRLEGDVKKAYNYIFATSTNAMVYFSGPHKNFPSHHYATSTSVAIESLFGHPFTKGRT